MKNRILILLALSFSAIYFNSCRENTILGTNLTPKVDNINTFFTDTISMITRNVSFDSAITSSVISANYYYGLGCINGSSTGDNAVGKTIASMALQFIQPQIAVTFPTDLVIDSIVLNMPLNRKYGDTINGGAQRFDVYRLLNPMTTYASDSILGRYYNSTLLPYDNSNLLGTANINFNQLDSTTYPRGEGYQIAQLRIPLDTNFARNLLNLNSANEYASYANFTTWLKGLYITPRDTNNGSIIGYFDYHSAKISLYTHRPSTGDSSIYYFPFSEANCGKHNRITRNFYQNNPMIANNINTNNPTGDSILFVQSNAGSSIQVTFPNIQNFPNAIINKAELEFTLIGSGNNLKDTLYRPVSLIKATGIDANNVDYILTNDYAYSSTYGWIKDVADGYIETIYENGTSVRKYRISLTRTLQNAISTHKNDLKIRLIGANGLLCSGRSILGGANKSLQKAKLNVIYTKLKR